MEQMKTLIELTEEIRQQECCKKYQECLARIKEDETLYGRLNEYRRRNMEIHLGHRTLEEEAELEKEFRGFLRKDSIREFFYWEKQSIEMLRDIHDAIDQCLELDVSFF